MLGEGVDETHVSFRHASGTTTGWTLRTAPSGTSPGRSASSDSCSERASRSSRRPGLAVRGARGQARAARGARGLERRRPLRLSRAQPGAEICRWQSSASAAFTAASRRPRAAGAVGGSPEACCADASGWPRTAGGLRGRRGGQPAHGGGERVRVAGHRRVGRHRGDGAVADEYAHAVPSRWSASARRSRRTPSLPERARRRADRHAARTAARSRCCRPARPFRPCSARRRRRGRRCRRRRTHQLHARSRCCGWPARCSSAPQLAPEPQRAEPAARQTAAAPPRSRRSGSPSARSHISR